MTGGTRREGRGRLSTLDMLPDEAEADLVWALETLRERAMPQAAILDELNARLADRGIGKVSKSSFNRWSIRKAIQFRRLDEIRAITGDIVGNLGTSGSEDVTTAVAEMLKAAVYERLEGDNDPKGLQALARSLLAAVAAQKAAADHRDKIEKRVSERVEEVADRAEGIMREAGLGETRIAELRKDFLGVRKPAQ